MSYNYGFRPNSTVHDAVLGAWDAFTECGRRADREREWDASHVAHDTGTVECSFDTWEQWTPAVRMQVADAFRAWILTSDYTRDLGYALSSVSVLDPWLAAQLFLAFQNTSAGGGRWMRLAKKYRCMAAFAEAAMSRTCVDAADVAAAREDLVLWTRDEKLYAYQVRPGTYPTALWATAQMGAASCFLLQEEDTSFQDTFVSHGIARRDTWAVLGERWVEFGRPGGHEACYCVLCQPQYHRKMREQVAAALYQLLATGHGLPQL